MLCSDCPTVWWCQSAWETMETSFVYFQLLKQAFHHDCLYQPCNGKIVLDQIDTIPNKYVKFQSHALNNIPIRPKRLLKSPVEMEHFLAGLTWIEKHCLIGWIVVKRHVIGWYSTGLKLGALWEYWVNWQRTDDNLYTMCYNASSSSSVHKRRIWEELLYC